MRLILLALSLMLPTVALAASSFGGTWRGGWNDPAFHQRGPVMIQVDDDGRFSGPIGNDTLGLAGVVSGTVAPDGTVRLQYSYDGGANVQSGQGQLHRSGDHLHGTVAFTASSGQSLGDGIFDFDLIGSTDI